MTGSSIRTFRLGLGLTQWELAEMLGVDQGRISRWERGIESPRPATAARLRDMMVFEEEIRASKRQETLVRHCLRPAVLMDKIARLQLANQPTLKNYRDRFGINLEEHGGLEFERFAAMTSFEAGWEHFRASGILKGELLLLRIWVNSHGAGHLTQYEPLFENGKPVRIRGEMVGALRFPENQSYSVERIEAVHLDEPDRIVDIFRGPMADHGKLA